MFHSIQWTTNFWLIVLCSMFPITQFLCDHNCIWLPKKIRGKDCTWFSLLRGDSFCWSLEVKFSDYASDWWGLGEKGQRIRELTSSVQKRFKFPENTVELYAEKVNNRGLWAIAQAESLHYKLLGGLAVRRYVSNLKNCAFIFCSALSPEHG